jgi:hypothetical protein
MINTSKGMEGKKELKKKKLYPFTSLVPKIN